MDQNSNVCFFFERGKNNKSIITHQHYTFFFGERGNFGRHTHTFTYTHAHTDRKKIRFFSSDKRLKKEQG